MTVSEYSMFLDTHRMQAGAEFLPSAPLGAIWVRTGAVFLDGAIIAEGDGAYLSSTQSVETVTGAEIWYFGVVAGALADMPDNRKLCDTFAYEGASAVLRLDQVTFPSGAVAYRHVHAGAGIRCLVAGELEIRSDHDVTVMLPGDAWFEAADTPVKATAVEGAISKFVRAMILPPEYAGKSTLSYLDAADAEKPRLQENRRFFDHRVSLPTS